jgi:hypothetical protein
MTGPPDSEVPRVESPAKKAWGPPRLTAHGTLPVLTLALSLRKP